MKRLPREVQHSAATSFFSFRDVDWKRTNAYSFGEYGQIRINLKGREPLGIVAPGAEYEKLTVFIMKKLAEIKDPATGERAITRICRKGDIYSGASLRDAPDILFEIKGLSYDSSVSFGFAKESIFGKPEFSDSGTHRRDGIIIAKGPGIREGLRLDGASILDVMPTVLCSMAQGILEDMDGKVLENIFRDGFLKDHPPRYSVKGPAKAVPKKELSLEEQEEVKKRLRSLGYLG